MKGVNEVGVNQHLAPSLHHVVSGTVGGAGQLRPVGELTICLWTLWLNCFDVRLCRRLLPASRGAKCPS